MRFDSKNRDKASQEKSSVDVFEDMDLDNSKKNYTFSQTLEGAITDY